MQLPDLARYRENYRLEAKSARGGLPRSVWESYSAFANSAGGLILLGAEERSDGTLAPTGVSDVFRLLDDFWNTINNEQKVSVNVLLDEDVRVLEEDGVKLLPLRVDGKEDGLYVERLLRAGCLVVVAERVGRNVVLPEELRLQVVPLLLRAVRVRE